ncbi:MAG: 50S ribosomal protein L1 [Candidatus Sumerlaeia bacterium]
MKHGKKYREVAGKIDRTQTFTIEEAVRKLRELSYARFDQTVEVHCRLGVDPRNSEQQVRGTVVLPHGTGKSVRVLVFAQGDDAIRAKEAGADYVGGEDLAAKIQGGWLEFEAAIATPDMMRVAGRLGKILGPRGLMPNPKTGTVTKDVERAIQDAKAGKVEYRLDRYGIVHCIVGKMSFTDQQLVENTRALLDALVRARPASLKGTYIKSFTLCGTMTPGVRVAVSEKAA